MYTPVIEIDSICINYSRRFTVLLKHKTNLKRLAIVLIGSGLLAACNQAGDSSTSANATQHAAVEGAKKTQKILRMVNNTGSTIDRIDIVSKSGAVVFKSNTGIACLNNRNCNVDINGLLTSKDMLAKFYNSKNQLISMAQLKDNQNQLTYMTVYVDSIIFGTNLFKHLVTYENSTPVAVFGQLTRYFKHSKNSHNNDLFQDLGNYYAQELKNGHITGEETFYRKLSTSFASHQTVVAPISQASMPKLMATSGCDNATGTAVFNFLTPFSHLPVGGAAIGLIVGEASAIFNVACPAGSSDTLGALSQINEKLDQISAEVNALGTDIAALRNLMMTQNEDVQGISIAEAISKEMDYNNSVSNFLLGVNESSIFNFVVESGGIDKVDKNKVSVLLGEGKGLANTLSAQNNSIRNLTSPAVLKQWTDILHSKCADYTTITDAKGNKADIIAATDICNLQAIQIGFQLAALSQQARLRMLDIVQAINTSQNPALNYTNTFTYLNKAVTWSDVPKAIEQDNTDRIKRIFEFMQNNVFSPRAELESMNINFNIPQNCSTTQFKYTKVFPAVMKYKDENGNEHKDSNGKAYDSITVTMACNGKKPSTRALLPGGVYHIDTSNNGNPNTWIGMDNAVDWEVNEKINPLIAPSAAVVTDSYVSISGHVKFGAGMIDKTYTVECPGSFDSINGYLESQGRDLRLNSCTTTNYKENGAIAYADAHYEIRDNMRTKLYIPLMINYGGYKTVTIWRDSNGLRADYYGQADSSNWVRPFSDKDYGTGENEFMNVQGYRQFKKTSDDNVINFGPN